MILNAGETEEGRKKVERDGTSGKEAEESGRGGRDGDEDETHERKDEEEEKENASLAGKPAERKCRMDPEQASPGSSHRRRDPQGVQRY